MQVLGHNKFTANNNPCPNVVCVVVAQAQPVTFCFIYLVLRFYSPCQLVYPFIFVLQLGAYLDVGFPSLFSECCNTISPHIWTSLIQAIHFIREIKCMKVKVSEACTSGAACKDAGKSSNFH